MGSHFEHDATTYTIRQSGRRFRIGFAIFAVIGVCGMGLTALISGIGEHTKLACDRARGSCVLTQGNVDQDFAIAAITLSAFDRTPAGAPHDRAWITLRTSAKPAYTELCGTSGDPAAAAAARAHAEELGKFLHDPQQPAVAFECESHGVAPNPAMLGGLFALGLVVMSLIFAAWSTTITARFDRMAQTVEIDGKRWYARRWSVRCPLSDVTAATVVVRPGLRGSRMYSLCIKLADGATATVWAPTSGRRATVEHRCAELNGFLDGARRR